VAAATRDHDSLDESLAHQAGLAFAAVNSMLQLKETLFAIGIHVIGNARTSQANGVIQNLLQFGVQAFELALSER
jgi:hypothetical protein